MRNVSPENNKIFWMAPILVLAIGTFPLPIGYYTLSRLVVCASAIYFAYNFYKKNKRLKLGFSLNSGQNKFLTKDQLKKIISENLYLVKEHN